MYECVELVRQALGSVGWLLCRVFMHRLLHNEHMQPVPVAVLASAITLCMREQHNNQQITSKQLQPNS
jgi:hypothetical protein